MLTDLTALISDLDDRASFLVHRDEKGQGLAEYALILALISIAAVAVMLLLGARIGAVFSKVSTSL